MRIERGKGVLARDLGCNEWYFGTDMICVL